MAVDLISFEHDTSDPAYIAKKIEEKLGMSCSIHQIADYLDINRFEDYEKSSKEIEYEFKNF